jgi:hypothetical protein
MVEMCGGAYGCEPGLLPTELEAQGVRPKDVTTADNVEFSKAEATCRECYLSCMLLRGADNSRYYQFKLDLSNDMTKGANNFLKTMVEIMCMLINNIHPGRMGAIEGQLTANDEMRTIEDPVVGRGDGGLVDCVAGEVSDADDAGGSEGTRGTSRHRRDVICRRQ